MYKTLLLDGYVPDDYWPVSFKPAAQLQFPIKVAAPKKKKKVKKDDTHKRI